MSADLIASLEDAITDLRARLAEFANSQDDSSDEDNERHIEDAFRALDALEGAVGDLVP